MKSEVDLHKHPFFVWNELNSLSGYYRVSSKSAAIAFFRHGKRLSGSLGFMCLQLRLSLITSLVKQYLEQYV